MKSEDQVTMSIDNNVHVLSKRVDKLRNEYFNYDNRSYFRNEAISYTTGTPWDSVYTPHERTIVPEFVHVLKAVQDSLLAFANKIPLPEEFWNEPIIVRHAIFFKEVLKRHPIRILDGELIVGSHFSTAFSNCLSKEESKEWSKKEEIFFDRVKGLIGLGVLNCGAVHGHIIPNHERVLKEGFGGIKTRAKKMLSEASDEKSKALLRAVIYCCDGVRFFIKRYSKKVLKLAAKENDSDRKYELIQISKICEQISEGPARNFREAIQAIWFQHILVLIAESYPGPGVSYGRLDQYIYPYYDKDLRQNSITRDEAKEILRCFFIKHNYAYDYWGTAGGRQGITSGDGQLITLSGQGLNGEDLTNDLTYMILEVSEEMKLLEPKINVRIHKNTPQKLYSFITEIISRSQGSPFLLNFDSIVIKALEKQGLKYEDAVNYGIVGCLENSAQGKDRSGTVDVNINLAKPIELALNQGRDMLTGDQIGIVTKAPELFETYDEFKQAVYIQLKEIIRIAVELYNICDELRAQYEPVPYMSAIIDGCIESGLDLAEGGAVYNYVTVEGVGFATAADSLAAIKKLVFEEKKVSMNELINGIKDNFNGHEKLRCRLTYEAPKYGNDIAYADEIAREYSRYWAKDVRKYVTKYTKRRFRAGYLSWNYFINMGPKTAATPDGRRRGEYLSNAVCPVQGVDCNGPTAAFKSVASLGFDVVPNGASYTPSFSPSVLKNEEQKNNFIALLKSYEELGGTAMQINIIDKNMLIDAQKNPEKYQNMLVRVTGYNAYFVTIGKALQDEIIARTIF